MNTITSKSGKKIIFRPLKLSDLDSLYQWVKKIEKEDTYILINSQEPVSLKEEKDYLSSTIKDVNNNKKVQLGAFYQDKYLGSCEITKLGKRQGHVGVFSIALDKDYRSEGVGFKLAQQVIDLAKNKLGVTQVTLGCFANNQVGINFYRKLGFTQCGSYPQAILYRGTLIDEILFSKKLT